jgi:hypothetical protein
MRVVAELEAARHRSGIAIVLALVTSLATVAILSRNNAGLLWVTPGVILTTVSVALLFRNRIALLAAWLFVSALIILLTVALLFSI